ncbi:MAG: DMT family transporter [Acidimicrobiales bacterium]
MAYLFALLAALLFALGTVLQQRGTLQTEAPEGDPRFLVEIVREPVWLAGGLCQALGWVLQAVALANGSLVVVQSMCALSLVFALPLGARLTAQHIGRRSMVGASFVLVGIIAFVVVGQPEGGISDPSATAWWISGLLSAVTMALLAGTARRRGGALAAALFAMSAGIGFAYQAAVTKVFVAQLGNGLGGVLTTWTTYALILSAVAGFALQQSALKTGFLAPAMAASNATTLVVSVVLGVLVFEEALSRGGGRLLPALIGLALAVVGVLTLARPEADVPTAATTPMGDGTNGPVAR